MCLIIFAYKVHPKYPLIISANRDEFYERPTAKAHWWESHPNLLAGKDLKGGGTWLGVSKSGRFAALTNYRDLQHIRTDAPTRGALVTDFLVNDDVSAMEYLHSIPNDEAYNGYNLLLYENEKLFWHSNVSGESRQLKAGIYGVSNALLDTPWPKVENGKAFLKDLLTQNSDIFEVEKAFDYLKNTNKPNDKELPDTGVGIELERLLSPLYIQSPKYGTRCSTVVLVDVEGRIRFEERVYGEEGEGEVFEVLIVTFCCDNKKATEKAYV
ncbi:MAG: NRDE family protein [Chitinophagales bacterium]